MTGATPTSTASASTFPAARSTAGPSRRTPAGGSWRSRRPHRALEARDPARFATASGSDRLRCHGHRQRTQGCPRAATQPGDTMSYPTDPRVDAYINALPGWQQDICRQVRDLVHAADPEVSETIKRSDRPYFLLDGNICALQAAKDHV